VDSRATCFHAGFLTGLLFDPEDGGDMILRNVTTLSTSYTALQPRIYNSSWYIVTRRSLRSNDHSCTSICFTSVCYDSTKLTTGKEQRSIPNRFNNELCSCQMCYFLLSWVTHCDMRPESRNNPLPDNGSLTHVSVTTSRKKTFSRQRVSRHRLKAGIVKPNMELHILLGNGSCTFPRQRIHEEQ
jgi:hypothetical protein